MEPIQDVEKVPKSRWGLVSAVPKFRTSKSLTEAELLYMQPENGCMYSMWKQSMLPGFPRHMRPEG